MEKKRFLELLDKHVDQEGFAKDLALELIVPELDKVAGKIQSGEIDLIPGTDLDKALLLQAIEFLKKQVPV